MALNSIKTQGIMMKWLSKAWEWYKSTFHGKGYKGYKTDKAKEKFADSLLKISDKMFWAPLAYLVAVGLKDQVISIPALIYVVIFVTFGMWLREVALKVIDEVESNKSINSKFRRKK